MEQSEILQYLAELTGIEGHAFHRGDLAGGRRMVRNDSSSYHRLFHRHPQGACSQNPEGQPRVPAVVREIRRLRKSYRNVNAI